MNIPNEKQLAVLRREIMRWFEKNGRRLPWRLEPDQYGDLSESDRSALAYRVWVSEIMLQQTTTSTVKGYFDRFMAKYPSVSVLAEADISDVLKSWEGLGYYRRAHQLHSAARKIVSDYNGIFPNTRDQAASLPGIGKYTVGAILSIAFDRREPILEANTIRLHSRLIGLESDPMKSEGNKTLWKFAEQILPKKNSGLFNQALMDLGSMICAIKEPKCAQCPCVRFCEAAQNGAQHLLPMLEKKIEKESRLEVAVLVYRPGVKKISPKKTAENSSSSKGIVSHDTLNDVTKKISVRSRFESFLLVRYPEGGRWTGLWDFPRFHQISDRPPQDDPAVQSEFELVVKSALPEVSEGVPIINKVIRTVRHSVTRYKITLLFCESRWIKSQDPPRINSGKIVFASGKFDLTSVQTRWVTLDEARIMPLSSTGRKLVQYLEKTAE